MKFDMGRAWNDAIAMIGANRDVLMILAGVFFFLPSLAMSVLAPAAELEAVAGDPERFQAAMLAYLTSNWWLFIVYVVASWIGTLALLALLGRHHKPTVGEAIGIAGKTLLPYIAASLILGFAFGAVILLIGMLAAVTGSPAVGFIVGVVAFILFLVIAIRMILVGPVMAIDGQLNPITAIARSWSLVKGNTRRVFVFLLLLMLAIIVIAIVLGIVFALIGAMLGAGAALWVEAFLGGILGASITVLLLAVYAAIHRQLSGGTSASEVETFE